MPTSHLHLDNSLAVPKAAPSDGAYVLDRLWRIADINDPALNHLGVSRSEAIGATLWSLAPGLIGTECERQYRLAMDDRTVQEFVGPSAAHKDRWLEVRIFPVPEGLAVHLRDVTPRVELEAKLRDREQLLSAIFSQASAGFAKVDLEGRFELVNDAYCAITGYSREQLLERRMQDITHPDDLAGNLDQLGEAVAGGESFTVEKRYVRGDGSIVWVNNSVTVLKSDSGEPIGILAVTTDRTEARRSEQQLRESDQRFKMAADSSPALIWMSDDEAQITFANQRYREFFEVQSEEMLGEGWRKIVHPDDVDAFHQAYLDAFAERRPVHLDVRVLHPTLGVRWLSCDGSPRYADGKFEGYVGVNIDITESKLAAEAIREREERLRTVLQRMPIGVIIAQRPTGEILVYNDAAEEIMGHPVLGSSVDEYSTYGAMHPDGRMYTAEEYPVARALLQGDAVTDEELIYCRGDGVMTFLSVSAVPLQGAGASDLVVCTFTDVSEQKRSTEHQRLMINELNHRVKNTLAIVQAVAQQTFKGGPDVLSAQKAFQGRLLSLAAAHDVLTRESWEAASMREVIERSVEALRIHADRISIDGPDALLPPKTAVSLSMAIHELGTNALKYGSLSLEGGQVSIAWTIVGSALTLTWQETGGPPVTPPARRGFGTRMIERGLAAELNGTVEVAFEPDGLRCVVRAHLPGGREQ